MRARNRFVLPSVFAVGWATFLVAAGGAEQTQAAEQAFKAQLVWATDRETPKEADANQADDADAERAKRKGRRFKEVEPRLCEKLRKVFKWKHYYEISQQTFEAPASSSKRVKISRKCELDVRKTGDGELIMKLFGEGKHVRTIRQPVKPLLNGEYSIIAGDDKSSYGDAWLVVISALRR